MNILSIPSPAQHVRPLVHALRRRPSHDYGIRIAISSADLEAVYRFRYRIHEEETPGANQFASHDLRMILDPLDRHAVNVAAWDRNRVVGVIRTNLSRRGDLGLYESLYDMRSLGMDHPVRTSIATRFIVDPVLRGGSLPMRLLLFMYDYLLFHGVRWNVIDCNDHLVALFTGIGYRRHAARCARPEAGGVNVMCLDLLGETHLRTLGSPCLPRLHRHFDSTLLIRREDRT